MNDPRFGPTGEYPQGKLTPEDEGGLKMGVAHLDGKVILQFGSPVSWIGLDPDTAGALARALQHHANRAAIGAPVPKKAGSQ